MMLMEEVSEWKDRKAGDAFDLAKSGQIASC